MRLAKQAIAALPTTLTLNLERFPAQSAASLSQHIVSLPIRCTGGTPPRGETVLTPESRVGGHPQKRGSGFWRLQTSRLRGRGDPLPRSTIYPITSQGT
jgi:hypothetical protein